MEQVKSKKKGIIIAGISAIVLIAVLGVSFAYWAYSRTTDNQILVAGDIFMKYTETNQLVIKNALPSKEPGENDYFEFKITGKNTYSKPIWYEIVLNHGVENPEGRTERLLDKFLKFRLVEIKGETEETVVDNASYEDITSKKIWVSTIPGGTKDNIEITYKLYMWISFDTRIGNTAGNDYDMETWNNQVYASVRVSVNGDFEEKSLLPESVKKVLDKAESKTCTYTLKDDSSKTYSPISEDEDGTIYFSGENECIDFNYVWYSGKLWRITAINPDGTMKMVTNDIISSITYVDTWTDFQKNTWIRQWLNEDFKDTLYNYQNIIVQNAKWNATLVMENDIESKPTEEMIVYEDVGLLNTYEYYQNYKNISDYKYEYDGYLTIGKSWWLLNKTENDYSSETVCVNESGSIGHDSPHINHDGVRPSIVLKSDIKFSSGNGSIDNPYKIKGDKEIGKIGEKINTRLSGEYVRVDNIIYRIVDTYDDSTKLVTYDYLKDENGNAMTKIFANVDFDAIWGDEETMKETNWAGYLNKVWLTSTLKEYLVEGTYYLGKIYYSSYKNSICSESNTNETTKSCTKTSSTWTGFVDLPRVGEMFATSLHAYEKSHSGPYVYLISPYHSVVLVLTSSGADLSTSGSLLKKNGTVYPTINLKPEVLISGGNGMLQSPYEVELPS